MDMKCPLWSYPKAPTPIDSVDYKTTKVSALVDARGIGTCLNSLLLQTQHMIRFRRGRFGLHVVHG